MNTFVLPNLCDFSIFLTLDKKHLQAEPDELVACYSLYEIPLEYVSSPTALTILVINGSRRIEKLSMENHNRQKLYVFRLSLRSIAIWIALFGT